MTAKKLVAKIRTAFKDVKLEDGVGLWEAQGLDYYATGETLLAYRKKDERDNWDNIPYKDLSLCDSSLSFFDAKGMRFCLPKLLIFDILAEELCEKEPLSPPDISFTLGYKPTDEHQIQRFSLLNNQQIQCVIDYLEYINCYEIIPAWTQKLK